MDPNEYSFEQNMYPAYNQLCQGQALELPMLEGLEIGGTHGTQPVNYQFGQGQASYTSVGAILETSQIIGGNDEVQVQQAQQGIRVGTTHGDPETEATYGIQQGQQAYNQIHQDQDFWTTGESMLNDGNELNILRSESLSGHHQGFSSIQVRTPQKFLTELPEGDEEEGASQTYQNPNILPSDANNLKLKAVLGPLTQKERKRLIDRRHRANVKAQAQKLRDDYERVSKEKDELEEKLNSALKEKDELKEKLHLKERELLLLKNHDQRNDSSERKAVFELNLDSVEIKAEAMNMMWGPTDIVEFTLNKKERRLELTGYFDVEALQNMLKMFCGAHLVSLENV